MLPDPIFAALEAANTAETAHVLACEALDERVESSMRACNAACERAAAARQDVLRTLPTTLGGLRALACHYARWGEASAEDDFLHIARSLQGDDLETAIPPLLREETETTPSAWTTICDSGPFPTQGAAA